MNPVIEKMDDFEFRCEFCDPRANMYGSYRALKIHMAVHKKFYKCPNFNCDQSRSSKCELKVHFRTHFISQRETEDAWRKYMVNNPKPASEAVGRSKPRASLKRQSSDDDGDSEFELSDSEMDFQVDPISQNAPSATTYTSARAKFQCDICYKVLSSKRNVENHMMIHYGEMPHQCQICQQKFRLAQNLIRHQKLQHSTTTKPQCPLCGILFRKQGDIKKHLPAHYLTKEDVNEAWEKYMEMVKETELITDAPENEEEMIDQNSEDMQEEEEPEDDVVHKVQCNICERKLSSERILKRHMNIHFGEKPFQCDICPARFRHNYNLKSHRQVHLVKRKIFKCPHCEVTASQQHNLKRHFRKIHFKCDKTTDEEWKKYKDSFSI